MYTLCVLTVLAQKITWFSYQALIDRRFSARASGVRAQKKTNASDQRGMKSLSGKALKHMQMMYFCDCE